MRKSYYISCFTAEEELGEKFVFYFLLNKEPRTSAADLALAEEDAIQRTFYGAVQRGVGKHDIGRFAAQFQRDPLQCLGGAAHNFFAHGS